MISLCLTKLRGLRSKTPKKESEWQRAGLKAKRLRKRLVHHTADTNLVHTQCGILSFQMLRRFLYTAARASQMGAVDPLADGAANPSKNPDKGSRVGKYGDARDKVNADTTSRLRYTGHYVCVRI